MLISPLSYDDISQPINKWINTQGNIQFSVTCSAMILIFFSTSGVIGLHGPHLSIISPVLLQFLLISTMCCPLSSFSLLYVPLNWPTILKKAEFTWNTNNTTGSCRLLTRLFYGGENHTGPQSRWRSTVSAGPRTNERWRCSAATAVLGTAQIVCLSNRKLWTPLQKRGTVNIAWHWVNRLFKVQGIKNMLTFHIELAQGATLSQCFFQHGCNMRAVGDINLNVEPIYPVIYRVFSSKCLIWCQRLNVAVFTQSIAIHSVWLYRGCGLEQSRTSEYELPQQTFLYSNARDSKWVS